MCIILFNNIFLSIAKLIYNILSVENKMKEILRKVLTLYAKLLFIYPNYLLILTSWLLVVFFDFSWLLCDFWLTFFFTEHEPMTFAPIQTTQQILVYIHHLMLSYVFLSSPPHTLILIFLHLSLIFPGRSFIFKSSPSNDALKQLQTATMLTSKTLAHSTLSFYSNITCITTLGQPTLNLGSQSQGIFVALLV